MQVFPTHESDFFRNRLTHSQIAESIAYRLNHEEPLFRTCNIDPRMCATAGLVHDMGHPPFGHNGERALDDKMREYGGFEGNAQTLRILSKLERKVSSAAGRSSHRSLTYDGRLGLNLTYRTLASTLKYDQMIPHRRGKEYPLVKGYYSEEAELVARIKTAVEPNWEKNGKPFKVVEVESKMGAVAGGLWPSPRFPSPLIEPEVPISGVRLSDWLHRKAHDAAASGRRSRRSRPSSP